MEEETLGLTKEIENGKMNLNYKLKSTQISTRKTSLKTSNIFDFKSDYQDELGRHS